MKSWVPESQPLQLYIVSTASWAMHKEWLSHFRLKELFLQLYMFMTQKPNLSHIQCQVLLPHLASEQYLS